MLNSCYLSKGHWLSIWHSVRNLWMRKKYWKYFRKLLMLSSTFISIMYFTGWLILHEYNDAAVLEFRIL